MTLSAPIERTISRFLVLHTPVTSAPNHFAICTANVPTPPDAPTIRTLCPDRISPTSRRPCRAVNAARGTVGRLLEAQVRGLQRQEFLRGRYVLREGTY